MTNQQKAIRLQARESIPAIRRAIAGLAVVTRPADGDDAEKSFEMCRAFKPHCSKILEHLDELEAQIKAHAGEIEIRREQYDDACNLTVWGA